MIKSILNHALEILVGLSGGFAVGAGFVGFITVLGVIPRLMQIAKAMHKVKTFGICATIGAMLGTYLTFFAVHMQLPVIIVVIWGLLHGIFVGMLAAALTEILNVFPIITKRINMEQFVMWFMMAIVFGKIFGSLFQWLIYERIS